MKAWGGSCDVWGHFEEESHRGQRLYTFHSKFRGLHILIYYDGRIGFRYCGIGLYLGGGFGVAALGLNVFSAEAEPATVAAPAVARLNVPT